MWLLIFLLITQGNAMGKIIIRNSLDSVYHPTITWATFVPTGVTPHWNGQTRGQYDPVGQRTWWYLTRDISASIYSTDLFYLAGPTGVMARFGGTGHTGTDCPAQLSNGDESDVQPWPNDRHPDGQSTVDTSRGHWYQWGGLVCSNGMTDLWRMTLNATPGSNTMAEVTAPTEPGITFGASLAYSSDHDVVILHGGGGIFGNPETWLFAPDPESNGLSAAQTAAGCSVAESWVRVRDEVTFVPTKSYQNQLMYDPLTQRVLMFGYFAETGSSTHYVEVWALNLANTAAGWVNKSPVNPPVNQDATQTENLVARISSGPYAGYFLYHRTSHRNSDDGQARDFLYQPAANTWTDLGVQSGGGPQKLGQVVFDPTIGTKGGFIGLEAGGVGNPGVWWRGTLN